MRAPKARVPKSVKVTAKNKDIEFSKLEDCHTFSTDRKTYFRRRVCSKDYRELPGACLPFDNWVKQIATPSYKKYFFTYYEVISKDVRLPAPEYYTRKIVTDKAVQRTLARCFIVQKDLNSIPLPRDPKKRQAFETLFKRKWPRSFEYSSIQRGSVRTMKILKKSIESCIAYRLWFRRECVLGCSATIDTESHDKFLLILQVLLAYIDVDSLDE